MKIVIRSKATLLMIAFSLTGYGLYGIWKTSRFAARCMEVTGVVYWVTTVNGADSMMVELRSENGELEQIIPVDLAWWTLPGTFKKGDEVTILYDPEGNYDRAVVPDQGRVDSWKQLWGTSCMFLIGGMLFLAPYALILRS